MTERCLPASLPSHACRPSVRLGHERSDTSSNDTHDEGSQGVRAVCAPPGDRRGAEGPERTVMGPPATMAGVRGPSRTLRACCMTTHSEKSPRTPRGHTGVGGCPQQLPPNKRLCPDRPQTDREGRGASDGRKHPRSQVRLSCRHFAGGPVHSSHELVRPGAQGCLSRPPRGDSARPGPALPPEVAPLLGPRRWGAGEGCGLVSGKGAQAAGVLQRV